MRIRLGLMLISACVVAVQASAQTTKYGVTVDVANAPVLVKASTYTFVPGQPVYDKAVDQMIVDAIDRELTARGVKKVRSGPSDLLVTYMSVRRTDVDLNSKPSSADGTLREYAVGTLVVLVTDPVDRQKRLFAARSDKPLDLNPSTYEATVKSVTASIFEKYPRRGAQ
jgi:Domain of unknown function (DUF4136)